MMALKHVGAPLFLSVFLYVFGGFILCFGAFGGVFLGSYLVEWQFLSFCGSEWSLPIIVDIISVVFSCFVCIISGSVCLFSVSYMDSEVFLRRFMWLIMAFVSSMNLLIFVPSLVTVLIGWDGLGIVSFALVVYYQNKKSLAGGMLTALANRVGDALLILCICLMVNWGDWGLSFGMFGEYGLTISLLLVVGGMTKSAQIPFSAWLPAAMAAPTPVSALVHSSTLVTAGVYLIMRFYLSLVESPVVLVFLSKIGGLTMLMAGLSACFEVDLKKIIALSTLSQLGLMMFTIGIGYPIIAVFHLLTHALFKALLFLCAGSIIHFTGDRQDSRMLGGIGGLLPFSSGCLIISSVTLCGMPFLSGFYSKDLILEGSLSGFIGGLELVVLMVGASLSLVYSLRLLLVGVFGEEKSTSFMSYGIESWYMLISMAVLSVGAIIGGVFLQVMLVGANGFMVISGLGKILISFVTFVGLLYMVINFIGFSLLKGSFLSVFKVFNSYMWYMSIITGGPFGSVGLRGGVSMHLGLDSGWMEVFGGQGAFLSLGRGMLFSSWLQSYSIVSLVRVFFFVMVFVFLMFPVLW
uniref:NADH-ubiquinone oxidoreductase chain 5 n=1 Tax=Echyridella menziesii TaxID=981778 RepID=A0A1X9JQ93_9BIVA|nr:NADH dehydrogenase subunit 5 [Echyridella menziesii]AQT38531.1 NADH dehydrogenase subunit 5 [Echyridella menziesii]